MFNLRKKWRPGVVQHDGPDLTITVPAQGTTVDEWISGVLFLGMVSGSILGFVPLNLPRAILLVVFDAWAFLIFRGIYEQNAAEQIVVVRAGEVTCTRKTRLWTRTRRINTADVTGVSASKEWGGFGDVTVTCRGRKRAVLTRILSEDAARFAHELKQALQL